MIDYTIYNTGTGLIHTTGTSGCDSVNDIVLNTGDSIIAGIYKQDEYKIISGTAQLFTPNFSNRLRKKRDYILKECDWTQTPDVPSNIKNAWLTYRQELRDITNVYTSQEDVIWPTKPV